MRNAHRIGWRRLLAAALLMLGAGLAPLKAQTIASDKAWPAKSIRIIVPYAPGGGTDVAARLVANKLAETLGRTVIVDNRPGGKSVIAYEATLREPPDGYTFLFNNSSHNVQGSYKNLPYDPVADFTPVSTIALSAVVLAVPPSVPAKNLNEFLNWVRQNPGKVAYGSFGVGTSSHLYGELLNSAAHVDMLHIAYKGSAPALSDLTGGHVQALFVDAIAARSLVQTGKIRALAITGTTRWKAYPDLPTFGELGYQDMASPGWWGFLAGRKVPAEIVNRFAAEIQKVVAMPDIAQKLNELGAEARSNTPVEFSASIQSDMTRWKKIVQEKNISIE